MTGCQWNIGGTTSEGAAPNHRRSRRAEIVCEAPPTHVVLIGCVHEHIGRAPTCPRHVPTAEQYVERQATHGDILCTDCWDAAGVQVPVSLRLEVLVNG